MKITKAELKERFSIVEKERSELQDALSDRIIADTKLIEELEETRCELRCVQNELGTEKRKKNILRRENLAMSAKLARAEELFMMAMDAWSFRENGLKRNSELRSAELAELDSRKHG